MVGRSTFVGRAGELAALAGLLEQPTGVGLLSGEPGIGKTRLLLEFERIAQTRGWSTLRGRASDEDGAPAFWLWRQVVRGWLSTVDEPTKQRAVSQYGPELAPVFPEFALADASAPPVTSEQRFAVFERFGQFIADAAKQGLVVLLDDLHWADTGSLSLLSHLIQQQHDGRMIVVVGLRPVEFAARPLGAELRSLIGRYGVQVELGGLSTAEVGAQLTALLGQRPEPAVINVVRQRTQGNPLFVQEVSRLVAASLPPDSTVPDVIRDAIRQHLAGLPEDCRRTLTVAAVLGGDIDVEAVAAITGTTVDTVLFHVDHAQRADVLAAGFGFRHDLFRETLQLDMPVPQRAALHLRVAEHWEAGHAHRVLEIARHRLAALPLGDPAVASARAQAAGTEAMAQLAFEDAADLFDHAIANAPRDLAPALRCQLLIDAGRVRFLSHDWDSAIERCTSAAEVAQQANDAENLGRAALALPELSDPRWLPMVQTWCEQALESLPEQDSSLRAQLLAQQSLALVFGHDKELLLTSSASAFAMAQRLGDDRALRIALRARQIACSSPEGHVERMDLGEQMLHLGRRTGDLDAVFWGHLWRFDAMVQAGRINDAELELNHLEPIVERLRQPMIRWHLLRSRGALEIGRGRFADARRLVDEVRKLIPGSPQQAASWIGQAMLITRLSGDDFDPTSVIPPDLPPIARLTLFLHLAPWHVAFGRPDEAAELYQRLPEIQSVHQSPYMSLLFTSVRGAVAAALKDADGAAAAHELLLPHADLHVTTGAGLQITLGSVQHFLGLTAAATGRLDTAIEHLDAGIVSNDQAGFQPYVAQGKYAIAELLRDRDHSRAMRLAREAAATAGQLGMGPLRRLTRDLIAALDDRAPASPLTPRQREVADLVSQGNTNKQIAAALHIAERTAESHVQNILTTLGFQTRSQIATWATQELKAR